jgi:O-antigen/teichoic acid export membrane protein
MTVTHTIGKGIAWNTVGSVVGKGVVFFNVFLVLRHLSVYEYGLSELVFSVVCVTGGI